MKRTTEDVQLLTPQPPRLSDNRSEEDQPQPAPMMVVMMMMKEKKKEMMMMHCPAMSQHTTPLPPL